MMDFFSFFLAFRQTGVHPTAVAYLLDHGMNLATENYDSPEPVNIGAGSDIAKKNNKLVYFL